MVDSAARPRTYSPLSNTALRWVAAVFAIALAVHAADHLRRGMDTISTLVMVLGWTQAAAAVVTVVLVFIHHRWAPAAAIVIGSVSAIGFTVVHLLPDWLGPLSDSFIDAPLSARVTGFSWFAAIFEITADLAIAIAGLLAGRTWMPAAA